MTTQRRHGRGTPFASCPTTPPPLRPQCRQCRTLPGNVPGGDGGESGWSTARWRWSSARISRCASRFPRLHRGYAGDRRQYDHAARRGSVGIVQHPQSRELSDNQIAQHCEVDEATVRKYRNETEVTSGIPKSDYRTGADGRAINTANIGRKPPPTPSASTNPPIFHPPHPRYTAICRLAL